MEPIETSFFTKYKTTLLAPISNSVGGRGKSGGARVIYYWAMREEVILLLYAYAKNEAADLTPKQVPQLAKAVKEEFGNESSKF